MEKYCRPTRPQIKTMQRPIQLKIQQTQQNQIITTSPAITDCTEYTNNPQETRFQTTRQFFY
jgi:hypothetical protein